MLGCFIGGFIAGAFCCFGTLVVIAVISINKKKKQFEKMKGGVR